MYLAFIPFTSSSLFASEKLYSSLSSLYLLKSKAKWNENVCKDLGCTDVFRVLIVLLKMYLGACTYLHRNKLITKFKKRRLPHFDTP